MMGIAIAMACCVRAMMRLFAALVIARPKLGVLSLSGGVFVNGVGDVVIACFGG